MLTALDLAVAFAMLSAFVALLEPCMDRRRRARVWRELSSTDVATAARIVARRRGR